MSLPREITQRDLRSRSAQIMDAVSSGESFVVTRSGVPIGELIPLRRRRFVTRAQFEASSQTAPVIDPDRLRADLDAATDRFAGDPYERTT